MSTKIDLDYLVYKLHWTGTFFCCYNTTLYPCSITRIQRLKRVGPWVEAMRTSACKGSRIGGLTTKTQTNYDYHSTTESASLWFYQKLLMVKTSLRHRIWHPPVTSTTWVWVLVSQSAVIGIWASPRFGHPHSQNPSDMGIPFLY